MTDETDPEMPACPGRSEHEFEFVSREFNGDVEFHERFQLYVDTHQCRHCGLRELNGAEWERKGKIQHYRKVYYTAYELPA